MLAVALDTFFGGGDFRCGWVGLPVAVPAGDLVIRIGATLHRSCRVSGIQTETTYLSILYNIIELVWVLRVLLNILFL